MSAIAYLLCTFTALVCAVLLLRRPSQLLFWGGICFLALAIENAMVYVDVIILPKVDISAWRALVAVIGLGAFVWALIQEALRGKAL